MTVNSVAWLNKQDSQLNAQNLLEQAKNGDVDAIDLICSSIYDSTAGRLGTNEVFVETILTGADSETLAIMMDKYKEITGSEIYKDIENDFSGKKEKELLAILEKAYQTTKQEKYTGWNDGKLSVQDAAGKILEGVASPITSLLKSPENLAIGVGITLGCIALSVLVPASIPFIIGAGATMGAIQAGYGVYQAATAETDEQAKEGFESMGAGGVILAMSAMAAGMPAKTVQIPKWNIFPPSGGALALADGAYVAAAEAVEVAVNTGAIAEGLVFGKGLSVLFAKTNKTSPSESSTYKVENSKVSAEISDDVINSNQFKRLSQQEKKAFKNTLERGRINHSKASKGEFNIYKYEGEVKLANGEKYKIFELKTYSEWRIFGYQNPHTGHFVFDTIGKDGQISNYINNFVSSHKLG